MLGSQLVVLKVIIRQLRVELKNISVLSQGTYWQYQLQ
jgi:hypothetical protein